MGHVYTDISVRRSTWLSGRLQKLNEYGQKENLFMDFQKFDAVGTDIRYNFYNRFARAPSKSNPAKRLS